MFNRFLFSGTETSNFTSFGKYLDMNIGILKDGVPMKDFPEDVPGTVREAKCHPRKASSAGISSILGDLAGGNTFPIVVSAAGAGCAGFGASVLLEDREVFRKLAETLGDDLWILPSSVHEVLVLPVSFFGDGPDTADNLRAMIREINATEVRPEERLSDHPYRYRRETGAIETA